MHNIKYHDLIKNHNKPEQIRKAMVDRYYELDCNASEAAREFNTKRQTVKKWVKRFEEEGVKGLVNRSKAPHTPPKHKTPKEVEDLIVKIAKAKKYKIGQDRIKIELKDKYNISLSPTTINRIMHEHDLIKKRTRKHQKKRQCSEYKRKLKALRNWQIDVKELRDIPNIAALVYSGIIPNYQYTARDEVTGTMFVCYGWEHNIINSTRFVSMLFEHLKRFGVHPSEVSIQTDNGSEFIGNIRAKKDSLFSTTIEKVYRSKHKTIPVGKKEYQGVVESSHGRIEYEFYDVERFDSLEMFLSKAYTYVLYWNLQRKKLESKKSPMMLIKEKCGILDPGVCDIKPTMLDSIRTFSHHYAFQGVPYVGGEVTI